VVKSNKPTQGEEDLKAAQKSYWLIVLRDRESLLHGEAANRNKIFPRQHKLSSKGGYEPKF
jgi:hypothetical protein